VKFSECRHSPCVHSSTSSKMGVEKKKIRLRKRRHAMPLREDVHAAQNSEQGAARRSDGRCFQILLKVQGSV
jgi:hypothetical protein